MSSKSTRLVRFAGHIPTLKKARQDPPTATLGQLPVVDGRIDLDQLRDVCFALGKMLQAIPKEERKLTITRLCNVAKTHRKNGDPPLTYLALEALIGGWEDWPNG